MSNEIKVHEQSVPALGSMDVFNLPSDGVLSKLFGGIARNLRGNASKVVAAAHGQKPEVARHLAAHALFLNAMASVPQTAADITRPPKAPKPLKAALPAKPVLTVKPQA